jgi:glycosyltransferase involved in cell wall biosynthesis
VRSGIADYSVDLLPHLAAAGAHLRVLGLPGQPVDPEVAERFAVVGAEEARPAGGWAAEPRLALYQMGNNRHHQPVEAMALERPGVLTLHDLVLHHLVSEETLGERNFDAYRRRLVADHGWIGAEAARPREWGADVEAMLFALPAHRTLLRRQRGVLVHNRYAAARIAEEDPEVRVAVVPMAIPLPVLPSAEVGRAFRRHHGVPEGAALLGSFGFQTPIKRTERVVAALAAPPLAGVHLLVVGETLRPAGRPGIEDLARELGVADRLHVTGFVPYAEFEAAIAACDLALNLRYPTAGETSASLLRVLALGRPAVVSDHAQFAELPAEIAVRVPLAGSGAAGSPSGPGAGDPEVAALVHRLAELLAAPERLAAMGRAAREHVRTEHDPAAAARAIVDACRRWRAAPPPGDRLAPPPPPTSRVREELPGTIEWVGASALAAAWPAGERRRLGFRLTNTGPARWLAAHRGPGGMALQVSLVTPDGDLRARDPWLALPRDLEPGESLVVEALVRRPPAPAQLRVATRVAGLEPPGAFTARPWGGPSAEWELPWP